MRTPTGMSSARFTLATMGVLLGACVDPRIVGQEHMTGGGSGTGGASENLETEAVGGSDDGSSNTSVGTSGGESTGPSACPPPPDVASCFECECEGAAWSCSDDACVRLVPGFELTLTEVGGCGDLNFNVSNDADSMGVRVWIDDGLAEQVIDSGEPANFELSVTDPRVDFVAWAGVDVTAQECQDFNVEGIEIHEEWRAVSGEVSLVLLPLKDMPRASASVAFVDVVLERVEPGPDPLPMSSVMFPEVIVGGMIPG